MGSNHGCDFSHASDDVWLASVGGPFMNRKVKTFVA
jgi:hypothetical protein